MTRSFKLTYLTISGAVALAAAPVAGVSQTCTAPQAHRVDQVDSYHGTPVADPYRWLEDVDSRETRKWIEQENCVTFAYLEQIPEREKIERRLTELWNYERYGAPFKEGGRYFYFKNDGLQNQSVLYTQESLTAEPRILLDPNKLSTDGTKAISTLAVSRDGKYMVYGIASAGSDWQEFFVRDVATGTDLSDHLEWIKFSGASWTHDGEGFFYSRYPEPTGAELRSVNRNQKLYYHRLGTNQSSDVLIYERPGQPEWGMNAGVSEDGRYAIIFLSQGTDTRNRVYYMDLKNPAAPDLSAPVTPLLDGFDASYSVIDNDGPVFFVNTNLDAPRYRLVAIDTRRPERTNWKLVIPESDDVLQSIQVVNGQFVARYMHDAHSVIRIFNRDGSQARTLELPAVGTVAGITGHRGDTEMFYTFTSFLYPTTVFRYDFTAQKADVFKSPRVDFDPSDYVTKQVFYRSKDGTRIPMFITHRKGIKLDGSNPTYLYAYGGFNISLTPRFSTSNIVWLEMGGVYAQPNLRGGGEYGEEWHRAGMFEKKQNVFDDFIAAAEYLIREGYTSTPKLAIGGASNGGLLVGATLTQRPDLMGAALPAVGVMDMLRFHKFTIGWAWVSEYGSADSASQFDYLRAYSPLHNIRPGTEYPATMVTTADHDDRVVPGHSFKFAAALQAAQSGDAPILIRVETDAGHGAGKPTSKIIAEQADRWAFLYKNLGMGRPSS